MKKGDIVVCIVKKWDIPHFYMPLINGIPKNEKLYTIRETYFDKAGCPSVRLDEIINKEDLFGCEIGWEMDGFREVLSTTEYNTEEIENLLEEPVYV